MTERSFEIPAFYARRLAPFYDASIGAVVPLYGLFQHQVVELVAHAASSLGRSPLILDVGIGSGAESIGILRAVPDARIVGVDFAEKMKPEFERRFLNEFGCSVEEDGRMEWCQKDFLKCDSRTVDRPDFESVQPGEKFDFIVSGFTIHHFPTALKLEAFKKSFDLLADGGLFINLDLASFDTAEFQQRAVEVDANWISSQLANPNVEALPGVLIPGLARVAQIPEDERSELSERWIDHHAKENDLDSVETQTELLRQAGFRDVECMMRFWQVSLIWAKK